MAEQTNVSPDAMSLNDRLTALHNAGHSWMDPTLQVHLATNGGSNQNMLATADTYKNVLNNTGTLPTKQYSDPAMNAKPSSIQQVFSTLHNAYAPVPILTTDINEIQKNMQAKGYAQGLTPGTWNPAWQQALNQHATDQLNAPGIGNTKSLPLWKGIMADIQPSGWSSTILHSVASYIHHLPGDLRQMISDAVGGSVALATENPFASSTSQNARSSSYVAGVENALGGKTTQAEVNQNYINRNVQDLGNIANLILLKGVGGSVAKSVGAVGETLATTAADKGVTQAAKDLVTRSLPETFAAAPRFTLVKSLYQAGEEGQKGIGFLRALENAPVLKRILPAIDGLDAEGSRYYAFKNAMAQSMRIPLRQLGAQIQAKGSVTGLGLLASSEAQKAAGVTPTYDATGVQPYSGYLGDALNTIGMFVGAPTQGLSASQNVGQLATAAHEAYSNALGATGIDVAFRKGLGVSLDDFKKNLNEEFTNTYVNTKVNQFAASHYAEQALQQDVWSGKLDRTSEQYAEQFMAKEHEALMPENIDKLQAARESLLSPQGKTRLGEYFANEYKNIMAKNIRKGVTESYDVTLKQKDRFWAAMKDQKALQELGVTATQPEHRNLWAGSATMTNIQDHLTNALSSDWATKHPAFDQDPWATSNEGTKLYHINGKVNEFAPDSSTLSGMTPYGNGVWATENQNMVGRTASNIFALQHDQMSGKIAKFLDLTKTDASANPVKYKLSEMLGGSSGGIIKGTAGARANSTVRHLRDELGLMTPGKTEGALVNIPKETYTPEYKQLQKMLTSKFNVSSQDVLDQYRKALIAGGKLNKDQIDLRIDNLTKSVMSDGNYTGMHYLHSDYGKQTLLNPDLVTAKMVKQDPSLNVDSLMPNYLLNNNVVQRGAFGFARKDTIVAQDAYKKANQFMDELAQMGHKADVDAARSSLQLSEQKNVEGIALPKMSQPVMEGTKEAKLTLDARAFLVRELGFSQNEVTRLDALQAVGTIWKQAGKLASEASLPLNAPQALKDVVTKADALGFRPVLGTDIGHSYENPLLHPVAVDQRTSMLRKAAMRLGIDPTKINDITTSMAKRTAVETEVNKLFASNKVSSNFGDTGNSIYSILLQGAQSGLYAKESRGLAGMRGLINGLTGRDQKLAQQALGDIRTTDLKEGQGTLAAARDAQVKAFNQAHQIRDLSLKQMVKILTRPVDPLDPLGSMASRYTPEDAMKIAKAVLIGYAKTPSSLLGIGKAEDFVRASNAIITNGTASFFGKVPVLNKLGVGEGPLANAFASLPNDLARARDKWRFDMNPVFAFRRLAKTNVKAAAEGIPPTRNAYESLTRLGVVDQAFNTLNRTMPDVYRAYKDLEPLDKFLQQSDVFGIYNPAHMMAWQAHNLEKLGLTDAQITEKLTKINTYGDRTPLERTVNTIFYPFSFNKTLYRSVGGYLLDHPGETTLINAGFNLYSHYDPNNDFGKWVTKHLPVLNELKKLNAFDHGTGLGQLGGINAPYISQIMNLFSPQMITPKNSTAAVQAITNAIPALGELNTLLFGYNKNTGVANLQGSAVETGKVGFWAAQNLVQHAEDLIQGHQRQVYQTTLTDQGQIQAGQDVVSSLKTQLAKLMNTNEVWANKPEIPAAIRGMKFNSTSFGLYAQSLYPAYDPSAGAAIALKKNSEALKYLGSLQGTFRYDAYKTFTTLAASAIAKLRKTNDPTAIQNAVNPLRAVAVNIAEQDPKFVSFYKKFYANALGPIEGLSK
jgi:hypothetical protein